MTTNDGTKNVTLNMQASLNCTKYVTSFFMMTTNDGTKNVTLKVYFLINQEEQTFWKLLKQFREHTRVCNSYTALLILNWEIHTLIAILLIYEIHVLQNCRKTFLQSRWFIKTPPFAGKSTFFSIETAGKVSCKSVCFIFSVTVCWGVIF